MYPIGKPDPDQRTEAHGFEHSEDVLPAAKDRRLVHRMLYFWAGLKGDAARPSIDDLEVAAMPEDWRSCFLLSRSNPDGRYVFDVLGEAFLAECERETIGPLADVPPGCLLDHTTRPLPLVLADKVPVTTGGDFHRGRKVVRFRSILLPFEGRVSSSIYLLGAANSREFAPRHGDAVEELKCYRFDHGVWSLAKLPETSAACR